MNSSSYTYTHPGYVREINEDSFICSDENKLWIVCDGMGGHEEGNFASRLVTDSFESIKFTKNMKNDINLIIDEINKIHTKLITKVEMLNKNCVIGTTLILLYVIDNQAVLIQSGDSRCYKYSNNSLTLINKDHAKQINTPDGIKKVLTSSIYAPGEVKIEIKEFNVCNDDVYILCTDGFYDNLSNIEIQNALMIRDIKKSMNTLKDIILNTSANDNLTAIIVRF